MTGLSGYFVCIRYITVDVHISPNSLVKRYGSSHTTSVLGSFGRSEVGDHVLRQRLLFASCSVSRGGS